MNTKEIIERQRIKAYYKTRVAPNETSDRYTQFLLSERNACYQKQLHRLFGPDLSQVKLLEIGAGGGGNLMAFEGMGLSKKNLFANELMEDRLRLLKPYLPESQVIAGDALDMSAQWHGKFDVVFQSLVFSSILQDSYRQKLAEKMMNLCAPKGYVLWYDFAFNNPGNNAVKGIGAKETRRLFAPMQCLWMQKVTLAPPIGRKLALLYPILNRLPWLRTHRLLVFKKP